ncbi:AmmeMemoRadiSam system protein B [Caldisericum sp.]|uniref:AmmeMemoRadiSam system protein B n=1 Tax=Caldisericum sp. TaxID=2499687 RepID=UPI003D0E96EF
MGKQLFKLILPIIIFTVILVSVNPNLTIAPEVQEPTIIGGVVPHHLVAKDVIKDFYENISKKVKPDVIVLLSPDHFGKCVSIGASFITGNSQFHELSIAIDEINKIKSRFNIIEDNASVYLDHGIANHVPFLNNYFKESLVIPILVSPTVSLSIAKEFADTLNNILPLNSLIIASVDFSHYLPKSIEEVHDKKSLRVFLNFEENEFPKIDVDSWQSLYILRSISIKRGYEKYEIIAHKNAQDYTREYLSSSTSYVSCIFEKGKINTQDFRPITLSFVGDIMLDRGVYKKILLNSYFYPFYNIEQAFRGLDYVVGNLEGPITYKKVNFPRDSLRFCFDKDSTKTLQYGHFNIVSLANNHTDNMGVTGIKETKEILKNGNIEFFGEPWDFTNSNIIEKDGIVLVGFNATFPFKLNEVKAWIKHIKESHKDDFLILFMHFGEEYIDKSTSYDSYLAHTLIDEGADLIIGSHPHVVKDIELYASKKRGLKTLIFYSLGNFVFDQYFSKETQEGLIVFIVKNAKNFEFVIEPVSLYQSQPKLMEENEREKFLMNLANRSDMSLRESIKKGMINLTIDYQAH